MSQEQYNIQERKFRRLNEYQRGEIKVMLKLKFPKTRIAKELGISRSTLYEEIK